MNEIIVRGLLCLKSMLSAICRQLSAKSMLTKKNNKTSLLSVDNPYIQGRTTARRDKRPKIGSNYVLETIYRCLRKIDMTVEHPKLVRRTTEFRDERYVEDGRTAEFRDEQHIDRADLGRTTARRYERPKIDTDRWRRVLFCRRNAKKLGRNAIPLKLSALSFSLATILFCVCLAHARQRGVGSPAAAGVALSTDSIKSLQIGDTIPNALWNLPLQMLKAGQEGGATVTLNDYKGKLIILDFWATWCKPCIRAVPDLHALEESFDKSVKVIPVTYEKSTTIEQFMEMASQRQLIPTNGFSSIVEDKHLSAYFPHKVVPHTLIIWDNSLLAITSPEYLTREIITEIIEQKKSTGLIAKNEAIDADAFFLTAAYSQMNKHKPFYYTTIIPAIPSIRSNAAFINLGEKKVNRYYQVEKSILSLYAVTRAFGALSPTNPHDVVLEVAYPEAYKYIANRNTTQKEELNWRNRHAYNYEAIFPEQIAEEEINNRLKIDLDFFFNIKAQVEEREIEILLLKRVKDRKVTGSKGGTPLMVIDNHVPARMVEQQRFVGQSSSGAKSYLMNFPIQTLLAQTKVNPYKVFPVLPPIVDSTNLPKDFLLDLEFDQTYPDSASLQRSLNEKGLYLEKSFVRKKVIVVSELNYLQKTTGTLRFSPYGYLPSNHPYFNSQIIK